MNFLEKILGLKQKTGDNPELQKELDALIKAFGDEKPKDLDLSKLDDINHNKQIILELANQVKSMSELIKTKDESHAKDIEALMAENKSMLAAFAELKTKEENQHKILEERAKSELDVKVSALIDEAVKDGRIPAANETIKDTWKNQLTSNFEAGKAMLDAVPKTNITPEPQQKPLNADGGKQGTTANSYFSIVSPDVASRMQKQQELMQQTIN